MTFAILRVDQISEDEVPIPNGKQIKGLWYAIATAIDQPTGRQCTQVGFARSRTGARDAAKKKAKDALERVETERRRASALRKQAS